MVLGRCASGAAMLVTTLVAAACSTGPSFTEALVEHTTVQAQRVTLDDGSELAVGGDGDELVAQWREDGGTAWSEPQVVIESPGLEIDEVTVEAAGDIAVVRTAWYEHDDDEREVHERVDAAICRDFSCGPVRRDVAGVPLVDADGELVAVPANGHSLELAVWRDEGSGWPDGGNNDLWDDSWEDVVLTGPPVHVGELHGVPDVRMLDDGSFVTVVGRDDSEGCAFDLWLSRPGQYDLGVVASTAPRAQGSCDAELVETDGESVTFYDRTIDEEITFAREDGAWGDDQPDSGGLLSIDTADGFPMLLTDLDDGSTVAVGSPDTRRILAQRRPAGEKTWSPPRTVARAEPGQACQYAKPETIYDRLDVMYLVLCWPEGSAWGGRHDDAPPPATGVVLASADGDAWVAETLTEPAYEPHAQTSEALVLARGADRTLVWRSGAEGFQEVGLPLAHPTSDGVAVIGDTAFRVTGNPDDDAPCRPTWSVAPVTARGWGPARPITPIPDWAAGPDECYGFVIDQADNFGSSPPGQLIRVAAIIEDRNGAIDGELRRVRGDWRFRSEER